MPAKPNKCPSQVVQHKVSESSLGMWVFDATPVENGGRITSAVEWVVLRVSLRALTQIEEAAQWWARSTARSASRARATSAPKARSDPSHQREPERR